MCLPKGLIPERNLDNKNNLVPETLVAGAVAWLEALKFQKDSQTTTYQVRSQQKKDTD